MTQVAELPYRDDSAPIFEAIADRPWAVFLDSGRHAPAQSRYDILTAEPYATLITRGAMTEIRTRTGVSISPRDPFELLREVLQPAAAASTPLPFYGGAIGYFGYDLGRRLERIDSIAIDDTHLPEMAFGIYDWAIVVDHLERRSVLVGGARDPDARAGWAALRARFEAIGAEKRRAPFQTLSPVRACITRDEYARAFDRIKRYILDGDCYQANLAQRFEATVRGDPWTAYQAMRLVNPAPYGAYMHLPFAHVLSASPERFLRVEDGNVETRPIKGTRARIGHPRLDAERVRELRASAKDRAENLMIVDLLRNDLAKSCALGSVKVPKLFEVESFATVHHLVSTITGRLAQGRDALDLIRGAFPGGSITGAPKLRAMQIIEALEPYRRGIYCGSIGYIGYDGAMDTNIAIRTLVVRDGMARFWAGGGIVADSVLDDEYQETLAKAQAFLRLLQSTAALGVSS